MINYDSESKSNIIDELVYMARLGYFMPNNLFLSVESNKEDFILPDGNTNHKNFAIYVHEQMHFFQTIMTGYGQEGLCLKDTAVKEIIKFWLKNTDQTPQKRLIPLGYLANENDNIEVECILLKDIIKESLILHQIRLLGGRSAYKLNNIGSLLIKDEWNINPKIIIGESEFELNGIDIIESHAKVIEALYLFVLEGVPLRKTINSKILDKRYYAAYDWFVSSFGEDRAIIEFPIICDLALQTSFKTNIKSEEEWHVYHPAWRFVNLVEALKIVNIPDVSSPQRMRENYCEYCNKLTEFCGYEDLDNVLKQFSISDDGEHKPALYEKLDTYSRYRKMHPWCAANPFLDIEVWKKITSNFSPQFVQFGENFSMNVETFESTYEKLNSSKRIACDSLSDFHIFALSEQILGKISNYSTDIHSMQCGFGYWGIKKGCPYQVSNKCNGSFFPADGLPSPIPNTNCDGCTFEVALEFLNISVKDIHLNFRYKLKNITEYSTKDYGGTLD